MSSLVIDTRRASISDAAAIANVHDEAWHEAYAGMIPAKALRKMVSRRGADWWQTALSRGVEVLVIEADRQIVGYVTMGKNRVESLDCDCEVYELYLLPVYQGLGFGRRLFQAAKEALAARGREKLVVWTLDDNDRAKNFYRGSGGVPIAIGHEVFDGQRLSKTAFGWL